MATTTCPYCNMEVSESLIEAEDGYYVLIRVEDTAANRELNLLSLFSSVQWAKVDRAVAEKKNEIAIDYNEFGSGLDLTTIG